MSASKTGSSTDYLAVVSAFSKHLSLQAHPLEQIKVYGQAIWRICPWLERLYVVLAPEGSGRPDSVFLYDGKRNEATILSWSSLPWEDRGRFELFLNNQDQDPLTLLTGFPLSGGAGIKGWVFCVSSENQEGLWKPEDRDTLSVCTDLLAANLERTGLFKKVFHAKKEWERTVDAIRDVVMIIGQDKTVRRANRQLAEIGKVPLAGIQGNKCYVLMAGSQGQDGFCPSEACTGCPAGITFQTGKEATGEVIHAGKETVFQVWSYPIYNTAGQIDSIAVYEKDISEFKQMQQQLVQAEKMAVIGQLAAAVAHELNNPLSGVLSFSQIMLKEMDQNLPYIEDLKNIEFAALRCKKIVEDLLAFARKPVPGAHEPINLQSVISKAIALLGAKLTDKDIDIALEIPSDLPRLPIHPDPIFQILVNLISNAHDAMEKGGRLRLHVRQEEQNGRAYLVLSIQDNGSGIPEDHQEKIFDPFFTTKSPGEGTGLGLSICQHLLKAFNGKLEMSSQVEGPDRGTTFQLWLPLFSQAAGN